MTAQRLDAAVSVGSTASPISTTYSISAGSNRALVVAITQESPAGGGPPGTPPTVTYGGQTMTHVQRAYANSAAAADQTTDVYFLNDAGIAAASGTTISAATVGTSGNTLHAASYQGVAQETPTVIDIFEIGDSSVPTVLEITSQNGSVAVCAACMGNSGTVAWTGGVTEQTEQVGGTHTGTLADEEIVAGAAETYTATWTTSNRSCGVAIILSASLVEVISQDYPHGFGSLGHSFGRMSL